jgi:UDP-N-acetylglucosamine:LPS N-acetylglucosamine transferase
MDAHTPPRTGSVIFAGGGTGGHIFPALAIAEELLRVRPGMRVSFIVSDRPLDADILNKQILGNDAARFTPVAARPFGVRPRALFRFVSSWGLSVRECRAVIRDGRRLGPSVVVAMGGFVAAPAAQAARVEKAPVLLVNLDAVPGRANRWIAHRAAQVVTSADVADVGGAGVGGVPPGRGWQLVPPIVRAGAVSAQPAPACRAALGLDPALPTLLVTGGSQGATSINDLLGAFVASPGGAALAGWQVIHQTGPGRGEDALRAAYANARVPALVAPFFDRMGGCWGAADLAVCRSGAGTVGEVWGSRTPAIFLPYPYHKDQHQKFNAMALVKAGGAVLCEDRIAPDANMGGAESAGEVLAALLRDADARRTMRAALAGLGPADGAAKAAGVLVEMLGP